MQLKKFLFVIAAFLVWGEFLVLAQGQHIKGRVLDGSDGQPVEYANIGVVGTSLGTATDLEGEFTLTVTPSLLEREVTVSAVGYRTRVIKIARLMNRDYVSIELIPITYGINEVDIKAPSRIFYGMLKVAVRQIPNNYLSNAYSARGVYEESGAAGHRRLILRYADAAGYQQRGYSDAFLNRRYVLESGRRDFPVVPFEQGLVRVEELLNFDMIRTPGNVLDTAFLESFEISEKRRYLLEGKHVLVLKFKCVDPQYAWTGDAMIRAMSGEIHIAQEDLSILKTVTEYESAGRHRAGRSFFSDGSLAQSPVEKIEYVVETDYSTISEKLVLRQVNWKNRVFVKGQTKPKEMNYQLSFEKIVPGKIAIDAFQRSYYDEVSVEQ